MKIIYNKIKAFETIIIHGHINPDGDCYGAQLGLKDAITATFPQKKVYAVGQQNHSLSFVGVMDEVCDSLYQSALAIVVDCGQENKISDQRFKLAKDTIRIDHHLLMDNYCNYQWVDANYSSCSQMIFEFKEKCNMKLTHKGALAMYVGMVTDTGNFCFDRVDQNTLKAAASLLAFDLDVSQIFFHLNKETLTLFQYKAYIYQNVVTSQGFAYVFISQETLKKFNLHIDVAASLVNILGHLENHPVWAFFLEQPDLTIRARIRSRGPEINSIARQFKGGGHLRACGATLNNNQEMNFFIAQIKDSIKAFETKSQDKNPKLIKN
ncbi:DHH family phosphoesterase [Candidatus Phytoplasma asteris]|uniref:DHH family phosphoesterase n=1 Tax=Candidatus Phytoplasma asteris TaxID=85620 RepID=UPI0039E0416F